MLYDSPTRNQPASAEKTKPFVIENERQDQTPDGHFRPVARVVLTPALRTSGLLQTLPAEEIRSLLLLFTFVSPNGRCSPSVFELAQALQISKGKLRARMRRLTEFAWQGEPLVTERKREGGLDAFAPSSQIVAVKEAAQAPAEPPAPVYRAVGRDAVIAHSRERYGRPRAEVEAEIARNMGWKEEGDSPEAQVRRRLLGLGVLREQVDLLLSRFSLEAIERQLEWLPYRRAKNPAAFVVAAIESEYEAPLAVRLQQAVTAEPETQAASANDEGEDTPPGEDPAIAGEEGHAVAEENREPVAPPLPGEEAPVSLPLPKLPGGESEGA